MILVVDASAAFKLLVDEDGTQLVRRLWDVPVEWTAPTLVVPEVAAAITASRAAGRLSRTSARRAHRAWESIVDEVSLHVLDVRLAARAAALSRTRPVRGADAVYLALAHELAEADVVGLVSFDQRQRVAADADGLPLLPAVQPTA